MWNGTYWSATVMKLFQNETAMVTLEGCEGEFEVPITALKKKHRGDETTPWAQSSR